MNEKLEAAGKHLLRLVTTVGTRAVAAGVKSIAKDGHRVVKTADQRFRKLIDGLEEMGKEPPNEE
jgi:hypothetical protein